MILSVNSFYNSLRKLDASADKDLKNYFEKTQPIRLLEDFSSNKVLAIGIKGIGKTAAYRHLTESNEKNTIVIGINWRKYTLYLQNRNLNYSSCQKQFEHDFIIEALKAVTENSNKIKSVVSNQLIKMAKAQFTSYKDILKNAAGQFSGISILGFGFTLNKPDTPLLVGLCPENEISAAKKILQDICRAGVRIRIVIDDPELVFSATQDLDTHLIGGLFLAAIQLSSEIKNLKIIVLVKTHIHFPIVSTIEEFDKCPDASINLSWTKFELISALEKRIEWTNCNWSDIFATPEAEARKTLKNRICSHLRNGPRELLRWCFLAHREAREGKIDLKSIKFSEKEFSKYALNSLKISFSQLYPKIDEVIKQIFRGEVKKIFRPKEFKVYIEKLLVNNQNMRSLWTLKWLQSETHYTLPEILFKVGGISFKLKNKIVLPYEKDFRSENFESATSIFLTPALRSAI